MTETLIVFGIGILSGLLIGIVIGIQISKPKKGWERTKWPMSGVKK